GTPDEREQQLRNAHRDVEYLAAMRNLPENQSGSHAHIMHNVDHGFLTRYRMLAEEFPTYSHHRTTALILSRRMLTLSFRRGHMRNRGHECVRTTVSICTMDGSECDKRQLITAL
ncbi:hypothetical protein FOZ62_018723, partial [Perkinsus olseni]